MTNGLLYGQNQYPNFELDHYKDKFLLDSLAEFDLDLQKIRLNQLYALTLDDYYCIFQQELSYSSVDINPYYLYSLQSTEKNYTSITILHYKEALYTNLYLLTFDRSGKKFQKFRLPSKVEMGLGGLMKNRKL